MVTLLTHWGRVMHICVSDLISIGSDNGLSPGRRQAIIWTNAGILLIRTLGTNFSEIIIEINTFSLKKMHLKVTSAKRRPFCLGLNVLKVHLSHVHAGYVGHLSLLSTEVIFYAPHRVKVSGFMINKLLKQFQLRNTLMLLKNKIWSYALWKKWAIFFAVNMPRPCRCTGYDQ